MSREQSDDEDSAGDTGIIRFGPPNGATPKWLRHGLPLLRSPEPEGQLSGTGAHPVESGDGRRRFGRSYLTYPGLARCQPDPGIYPGKLTSDQVTFGLPSSASQSLDKQLPGSGARPVVSGDDRRMSRRSCPPYPGWARRQPIPGIQSEKTTPDRAAIGLPGPAAQGSDKKFVSQPDLPPPTPELFLLSGYRARRSGVRRPGKSE